MTAMLTIAAGEVRSALRNRWVLSATLVLGALALRRVADRDDASHDVDTPEDLAWWRATTTAGPHARGGTPR